MHQKTNSNLIKVGLETNIMNSEKIIGASFHVDNDRWFTFTVWKVRENDNHLIIKTAKTLALCISLVKDNKKQKL